MLLVTLLLSMTTAPPTLAQNTVTVQTEPTFTQEYLRHATPKRCGILAHGIVLILAPYVSHYLAGKEVADASPVPMYALHDAEKAGAFDGTPYAYGLEKNFGNTRGNVVDAVGQVLREMGIPVGLVLSDVAHQQ